MSALTSALDAPAATALAWTLLHFLWQGAGLAAAFFLVARYARLSSSARYTAGIVTLAAMLVAPVATYLAVASDRDGRAEAVASSADIARLVPATVDEMPIDAAAGRSPRWSVTALVVALWAIGVCVLAVRLAGGWMLARRLARRALQPVSPEVESLAVRVAGRLALDRIVRVAQSSAVAVPVMVGWLKPVVLFPASVLAGLSPTQIEALLAHELAHIRRHDYLVNLLQSVVETLLFYHPAVWWVSRRVRVEREHCCDDLAIGICDRLVYVTALSELAALSATPRTALAATDGSLLQRIRRILVASERSQDAGAGWLPVLALMMAMGALVPIAVASGSRPKEDRQFEAADGNVQGGVPGGVAGGVPGGVVGGVSGGVMGGVSGGVVGGVQAEHPEIAPAEATSQGTAQTEEQRREAAKVEAAKRKAQLEEVQKALQALERERLESRLKQQFEESSAELETLEREYRRSKQLVEKGLLNSSDLARLEASMRVLQNKIAAARLEHDLKAREMDLRAVESWRQAELAQTLAEYERVKDQYALSAEEAAVAARDRLLLLRETVEVDQGEPIRAGDVLVIEIRGEPDVPRAYTVQENGTIRLPLSPPLRVQGLTVQQVAQDLVKQLTARGLDQPAVDVKLRRHRAPEGQ